MKIQWTTTAFLAVMLIFSCGNQPKDNTQDEPYTSEELEVQDGLWDQVMALHDEVMPEMSTINQLTQDLTPYLESDELDKPMAEKVNNAIKLLEAGEESMFTWMNELQQLGALRNGKTHEEIVNYLNGELSKMQTVKEKMTSSISSGQALLAELQGGEQ